MIPLSAKNILTFIIPVRHQDNAHDWPQLKRRLAQTVRSVSSQDSEGWKAVMVANYGADLPDLPKNWSVKRVDLPPNKLYIKGNADTEAFRDAVRIDKGARILAGMLHAGEMGHTMLVDDDDFVSCRLTSFVASRSRENGWYFGNGLVWTEGGRLLYRHDNFSKLCGTSHIIRSDLFQIPASADSADETYISRMLGSHIFIQEHLAEIGSPLLPLPFIGAIYRTGHTGAHSRSKGIARQYLLQKSLAKKPWLIPGRLARFRFMTSRIDNEFLGKQPDV